MTNAMSKEKGDAVKKLYTKGHKSLGNITVDGIAFEFFKSKTRNPKYTRFLAWATEKNFCVIFWKDGSSYSVSDVSRIDGKNWYSYANANIRKAIVDKNIHEFARSAFKEYEKLM